MKLASVEAIAAALEDAGVRYLVVGGLAVAVHGYGRLTKDVDMVIALDRDNILRAFQALAQQDYRPLLPVDPTDFADPDTRASWIANKHMQVMQLTSEMHPRTPIDIFVAEPFDFDAEYAVAARYPLPNRASLTVVSRATLIAMKTEAGRPLDLVDIQQLQDMDESDHE